MEVNVQVYDKERYYLTDTVHGFHHRYTKGFMKIYVDIPTIFVNCIAVEINDTTKIYAIPQEQSVNKQSIQTQPTCLKLS